MRNKDLEAGYRSYVRGVRRGLPGSALGAIELSATDPRGAAGAGLACVACLCNCIAPEETEETLER